MDKLLAVASSSKHEESPLLSISSPAADIVKISGRADQISTASPEDILELLRADALDHHAFISILTRLQRSNFGSPSFTFYAPGPLQAQMVSTLVNISIPTFWPSLNDKERSVLINCMSSVAGISALIARLKLLVLQQGERSKESDASSLGILLAVTDLLFKHSRAISRIWQASAAATPDAVKRSLIWKEFIHLASSGKIIGVVAQTEDFLKSADRPVKASWLSDGRQYAAWLGTGIATMLAVAVEENTETLFAQEAAAQLLARSLSLGYPVPFVKALITTLILQNPSSSRGVESLVSSLPKSAKRQFLEYSLQWLATMSNAEHSFGRDDLELSDHVSAVSALITILIGKDETCKSHLIHLITDPLLASSFTFLVRRSCISTLSRVGTAELVLVLEQAMASFSDQNFINHAAIVQQEALVQTLLLVAGYLHREMPVAVLKLARSSEHMQGVSNRLDSSNPKSRWLGMIVGTAISSLVDKPGAKMSFGTEEMTSEEAAWYLNLVTVHDSVGSLPDLARFLAALDVVVAQRQRVSKPKSQDMPILNGKRMFGPVRPPMPVQTDVMGGRVSEVVDDESDEDRDLKPYAKPDSDPDDSDEDATLVNRNKAKPPVYIRDLMRMLRDDKDHDHFQLGIQHAGAVIRRKTNFGGEVTDHAEEIASILCNLQDPFETEGFDELKLQALIAILLSDVKTITPWLSRQIFLGDYSLSQRCIMLSALGLGGRELAGLKDEDELNAKLPASPTAFPSKRLPSRLHALYSPRHTSVKHLESASRTVEHQLIKPMALSAADKATAHLNAVKVRTFSSRMNSKQHEAKTSRNQLAKIFGENFFFPLLTRYQQELAAYGTGSVFASAPFVLVTFLKTLALLLHASGPATLHLPEITTAFWDLLLSLRVQASSDISVLQAVLFSILTLFEINQTSKQRLSEENSKQLMETQQWTELIFERTGGGDLIADSNDDETKVRTLAAGILVRTREVIEAYQKRLTGGMGP